MKKIHLYLLVVFCGFFHSRDLHAQEGSMTVENSNVVIATGTTEMRFSQETYFGPEADWVIDGTLEVWSEKVWIAPTAKFSGSGRIIFRNPGDSPFYSNSTDGATYVDGNNSSFLDLIVEHANPHRILLQDLEDPGYEVQVPQGSESAQLNIGGSLELSVDGAHVDLNGSNLGFSSSAMIENAGTKRMVITNNSAQAHVIKQFGNAGVFQFPVGIAAEDYTPAVFEAQQEGRVYVSVEDYNVVPFSPSDYERGMDRIWNIYSPDQTLGFVSLTHNVSTEGIDFKDNRAFVYQADRQRDWQKLETVHQANQVHQTAEDVHLVALGSDYEAYFTKLGHRTLFIPNVITPGTRDGKNDTFEIVGIEAYDRISITIINRWGNEVYRNNAYQNEWDGTGLNAGVYYYIIDAYEGSSQEQFKGYITLIK